MKNLAEEFSVEARQALEKAGFVIYQLTGVSMKELGNRRGGNMNGITYDWDFMQIPSLCSQVALKPQEWIIPQKDFTWRTPREIEGKLSRELNLVGVILDIRELP